MTTQFKGVLEVDSNRGVIYFHHETGATIVRICSLPAPVPTDPTRLLDITHNVGVSWQGQLRTIDTRPGSAENFTRLLTLLDGWKCCGAPALCGASCQDSELAETLARAHRVVTEALNALDNTKPCGCPGYESEHFGGCETRGQVESESLQCTCPTVPDEYQVTYGGLSEPGNAREYDPHCPEHGRDSDG